MESKRFCIHNTSNISGTMGDDKPVIKIETAKFDARFPNQNQTKNCWQNFVDYQKCIKHKGEDYEHCQFFKKTYRSLCPISWVS